MQQPPIPSAHGVLRLTDWGLIRAIGPDARSFLQGQLTQDVLSLEPGQFRLAGYCNPKGRLFATFLVWSGGDDELLLACSADLLPATLKRLSMFVLRAKCKLVDATAELALWGVAGTQAAKGQPGAVLRDGPVTHLRLHDAAVGARGVARAIVAVPSGQVLEGAPLDAHAWEALEARSGVARVVEATRERFVPQMVNFELVGGINFHKGCYPGQEVVARSQYRGTLKRRAFAARAAVPMVPAQEIFHSADPGQPAGTVVLAGSLGDGMVDALVELKIDATGAGTLHLGAVDGPQLLLSSLPYALPQAQAA